MTDPNAPRGDWFRIVKAEAVAGAPTSADVTIYDQIGENWWGGGVSAKAFAEQLSDLDVDTIRLFINSPGGAAWDGVTIMNTLRRHRATVEVTVDGLAASAASVVAMAGDRITMNRGSELMIHDAWGYAIGNAEEMRATADVLGKLSDSLADTYVAKAGKDRAHWRALMQAETWYTAEEAVLAGLADDWADKPAAGAHFDTSRLGFAFAGRAQAGAPRLEVPKLPSSSEPGDPNRKETVVANDDLTAGLRERLGMTDANATDEQLLAAVDALKARAEVPPPAIPAGVQMIDATVLADLQAAAAAGAEARAEQTATRREGILAAALKDGRISAASKATWADLLEANEANAVTALDGLAKNAAVPVAEIGKSDGIKSEDDRQYAEFFGDDDNADENEEI